MFEYLWQFARVYGWSRWAVLIPAVIGMLICDAAVYFGVKFVNRRKVQTA